MNGRKDKSMEKPANWYLVDNHRGRTFYVWAASGSQAKRKYCLSHGISPSDYFLGVSNLSARKLKPEEVKAWESSAKMQRDTLAFIEGMMNICANACTK